MRTLIRFREAITAVITATIAGIVAIFDHREPDFPRTISILLLAILVFLPVVYAFWAGKYFTWFQIRSNWIFSLSVIAVYMLVSALCFSVAWQNPLSPFVNIDALIIRITEHPNLRDLKKNELKIYPRKIPGDSSRWGGYIDFEISYKRDAGISDLSEVRKSIESALHSIKPWIRRSGVSYPPDSDKEAGSKQNDIKGPCKTPPGGGEQLVGELCSKESITEDPLENPQEDRGDKGIVDTSSQSWIALGAIHGSEGDLFYTPNNPDKWPPEYWNLRRWEDLEIAFRRLRVPGINLKVCSGSAQAPPPDEQTCIFASLGGQLTVLSLAKKEGRLWAKVAKIQ